MAIIPKNKNLILNRKVFIDEIYIGLFSADYQACANALGINASSVLNIVNRDRPVKSPTIQSWLFQFCQENKKDFNHYFLEE